MSKNEQDIRKFLRNLDNYTTEEYLDDMYFGLYFEKMGGRNYSLFIEYMKQGFNRKRTHLIGMFDVTEAALKNIAHKEKWSQRAKIWESKVVSDSMEKLFPSNFNTNETNPWTKKENESYFSYFCFLCFLYLNEGSKYSQPQTAKILSEEGIRIVSQTLNQYSSKYDWMERCRKYQHRFEIDNSKMILKMLKQSNIGNIIGSFEYVWELLERYNISEKEYIEAFNTVVENTIEDCDGVYNWTQYFDSVELLEELLVFRIKMDPHEFTNIFDKYTDKSTSEINELIIEHCYCFDENIDDYKFYSSALDDL